MLIQFSVKNYKSFKEKQVFSMEAGTGDENIENIVTLNETNERILKTTALYGANASGKTNLISAFSAAIMMVRLSNNRQPGEKLMQMEPLLLAASLLLLMPILSILITSSIPRTKDI